MFKRVAVIDTERGSSRRYAKGRPFHFSVLELKTFEPETYVDAIKAAERAGFEVLVIDSLSHEWIGTGGALEQVDRNAKGGNTFVAWGKVTPRHNAVIDAIMGSSMHIIATMRSKMAHEQTVKDGKKVVEKLGLAPQQRDGIEFEFDVVGDLDLDNALTITKSRCIELNSKVYRHPGIDLAEILANWLDDGEAPNGLREEIEIAVASGILAAEERAPEKYKEAKRKLLAWCEANGVSQARRDEAAQQFKERVAAVSGPKAATEPTRATPPSDPASAATNGAARMQPMTDEERLIAIDQGRA